MNLFTSSSNKERKVLAVVCLVLLLCEIGTRVLETSLSKDSAHLKKFDAIAEEFERRPGDSEERILFLGNSLTRNGVDLAAVSRTFESRGVRLKAIRIMPDNTAIADWYYVYKNYFASPQRSPDILVIGFKKDHLSDRPSRHPGRLARFYCTWQDTRELFSRDYVTFGDRANYVLSKASAFYANSDRFQRRILALAIPGYRNSAVRVNEYLVRAGQGQHAPRTPTYERLEDLIRLAQSNGVEVVLSAMPISWRYELDPSLIRFAKQANVNFVDCREVSGITPDLFPDGLHMNEIAATRYSHFLASKVLAQMEQEKTLTQESSANQDDGGMR